VAQDGIKIPILRKRTRTQSGDPNIGQSDENVRVGDDQPRATSHENIPSFESIRHIVEELVSTFGGRKLVRKLSI
jgi:hypothetical protein